MKKNLLLSFAAMILSFIALNAQPAPKANADQGKKPDPEAIAKFQAEKMAATLLLGDDCTAKFIPLYTEYQKALRQVFKKYMPAKCTGEPDQKPAAITDKDIDAQIRAEFAKSQDILNVRTSYYEKFLGVLSPRQIKQM